VCKIDSIDEIFVIVNCEVCVIVKILLMFMVVFLVKSLNVFKSLIPMDDNYKYCQHTAYVQLISVCIVGKVVSVMPN